MSLPIRARLTAWYVALLALILLALGMFLVIKLRADLVRGVDRELDARAAQISLGLQNGCEGEFQDVSDASLVGLPLGESGAQVVAADGSVIESTGDPVVERPLLTIEQVRRVLDGEQLRSSVTKGSDAEPFRVLAIGLGTEPCNGVMVVATSLDAVQSSVHRLIVLLLVTGPVVLAMAGIGGWLLARRALRPVARMTKQAGEIEGAGLDERIDIPGSADELQRLAITLNEMLDRLEQGVQEKKRFVADASHELRTPLAVMSSELDVSLRSSDLDPAAREVLASARQEVQRMNVIVENLLTLARLDEGGLTLLNERADLFEIVRAAVRSVSTVADERDVRIGVRGEPLPIRGDAQRLDQVVTNLVGNAVKYSEPGTGITVEVERLDMEAICTVTDRGPGIEPELLPHIFDRFVRGDRARSRPDGGTGLGLAIAREIVEAHGGRIWVASRPGGGALFGFALPAEPSATPTPSVHG
ncbi:MAG: sensor histidine kinase [Actinomycetota bacterium]